MNKFVAFLVALLIVIPGARADWNSEDNYWYPDDEPWEQPEQRRPEPPPVPKEPIWPAPYTEEHRSSEDRASPSNIVRPDAAATTPDARSSTGWTGGADNVTPTGNPPIIDGRIPPPESQMPLASKALINDAGARTISASTPPGFGGQRQQPGTNDLVRSVAQRSGEGDSIDVSRVLQDSIRDWVAKEGLTLRQVLQEWCDIEGWELVWNTNREFPLRASAVFRGRFQDVSAALIRTFTRANPQPTAQYFFGNRVLVIRTQEESDVN